jgi:hypothetical protein
MLKFYYVDYTTYYKGRKVGQCTAYALRDEANANDYRVKITWENLNEVIKDIGFSCRFSVWNKKKGRQISFSNTWPWQEPKEWKHADPQIEIECRWTEREVSIQEVLEWHNSEKALQYLNERNLRIGVDK